MGLEDSPIFIRGMSRSGGTLMVTMLDAHPDVAMSYELYPSLFKPFTQKKLNIDGFYHILRENRKGRLLELDPRCKPLRTFIIRCQRGGLKRNEIIPLLDQHLSEGDGLSTDVGCLRFIARCARLKMDKEGKKRWGLKCSGAFTDYGSVWPNARFLNMVRDGRDVLASQLNTGSFNKGPAEVAEGWSNTLNKFRDLIEAGTIKGHEVFYEKLVMDPASELKEICGFLNLSYRDELLSYYSQDLTIYKSSHLSMDRICKPVDTSKLGRWREDLSQQQIDEFFAVARDTMIKFGFVEG